MKQSRVFGKLLSVLLAFSFAFIAVAPNTEMNVSASDYGAEYDNMNSVEKQQYIEQHLKEVKSKLITLEGQSEETEDYVNALNERITYLQMELKLSKDTINSSKKRIDTLEKQYNDNEQQIKNLKIDIKELAARADELQEEFNVSYDAYAQRAKAMYISGNMNTLTMLLTSNDISTLFTRLEMIKRVSKADKELLENLQNEGEELISTKASLEDKKSNLTTNQEILVATKENLSATVKTLEAQQISYNEKEKAYSDEKKVADKQLADLHDKTKAYGEYRVQDEEELAYLKKVNSEIAAAADDFEKRMESAATTTTTTKKQTTTTTTTQKPSDSESDNSTTKKPSTSKPTTTTTTTKKTTTNSNKLSMTYPVPTQKKITCDYGAYAGHTGVDFACSSGSRVVAAEDGEVIVSTDLKNSDGSYRSYGRYIVIAHYKKNSSGNYVYTLYAHNSSRMVSVGDRVTKGQLIAYSGSTGNSTGPHCHFEVRTPDARYESCVDPKPYLP